MSPETWLAMRYRDFNDVPRLVAVEYRGHVYLLDAPFDDEIDDYSDHYTVYRLPESEGARLHDLSWERLPSLGEELGRVPVVEVEFDETKREALTDAVFRRLGID